MILKNFLDEGELFKVGTVTTESMGSTSIKAFVSGSLSFAATISF